MEERGIREELRTEKIKKRLKQLKWATNSSKSLLKSLFSPTAVYIEKEEGSWNHKLYQPQSHLSSQLWRKSIVKHVWDFKKWPMPFFPHTLEIFHKWSPKNIACVYLFFPLCLSKVPMKLWMGSSSVLVAAEQSPHQEAPELIWRDPVSWAWGFLWISCTSLVSSYESWKESSGCCCI